VDQKWPFCFTARHFVSNLNRSTVGPASTFTATVFAADGHGEVGSQIASRKAAIAPGASGEERYAGQRGGLVSIDSSRPETTGARRVLGLANYVGFPCQYTQTGTDRGPQLKMPSTQI